MKRTTLVQMNDRGQAVGIGRIPSEGATTPYGFLRQDGVFTTIDPPGSLASEVSSIDNDGAIVGDYIGADGVDHGFIGTTGQ